MELLTNTALPITNGSINLPLPATQWRVIELTGPSAVSAGSAKQMPDDAAASVSGIVTASIGSQTPVSQVLGSFGFDSNGWVLGGEGSSARSMQIINQDGKNYLTESLAPTSANPLTYNGYALLTKNWDVTSQTAKFDTSYPINLVFDFATFPNVGVPWLFTMDGWFAGETNTPKHTTSWLFWPVNANTSFNASTFGVSNDIFATLTCLNIILPDTAARRGINMPYEATPTVSLGFSSVRLEGMSKERFFYIEDPDRSSGIRVITNNYTAGIGNKACVTGKLCTLPTGERCIIADSVSESAGTAVAPLGMTGKSIGGRSVSGGSGLDNTGLLVRTWGRVTSLGGGRYRIADGSGVDLNAIYDGTIADGSYCSITGIASCELSDGAVKRILYVRDENDIKTY